MTFAVWGIIGAAVVLSGCIIPSLSYKGKMGERYNPLNHFISELGEVKVSRLAAIFNISLITAGICFSFFMLGFGRYFGSFLAYLSEAAGLYACLSCSLVGFFPMNSMSMHMVTSMSFFYGGLAMIVLFGITMTMDSQGRLPSAFILFAAAVAAVFVLFLLLPRYVGSDGFTLQTTDKKRPALWMLPLLEWLVMAGLVGWIAAVSIYLL